MNFYYPQFQSPFGYDNINDRNRYLHNALYQMLHRHGVNDGYEEQIDPPVPPDPPQPPDPPVPEFEVVTFKVVNSKTGSAVDPDDVLIDSQHVSFASVQGHVTVSVPLNKSFHLTMVKDEYVQFEDNFTSRQLDNSSQAMTPVQTVVDEEESKVRWTHSIVKDLDTHLLVHDSTGKLLTEVYYNRKTWHDSNISVTLDRDDTGSFDGETLTISPLYADYKYTLVLYDYSNGTNASSMKMSQSNAAFTITYNNQSQTITIPSDVPGVFWNVYQVVNGELSIVNTVTQTNDYGITARTRGGK